MNGWLAILFMWSAVFVGFSYASLAKRVLIENPSTLFPLSTSHDTNSSPNVELNVVNSSASASCRLHRHAWVCDRALEDGYLTDARLLVRYPYRVLLAVLARGLPLSSIILSQKLTSFGSTHSRSLPLWPSCAGSPKIPRSSSSDLV